jgi:hypothetical protein
LKYIVNILIRVCWRIEKIKIMKNRECRDDMMNGKKEIRKNFFKLEFNFGDYNFNAKGDKKHN